MAQKVKVKGVLKGIFTEKGFKKYAEALNKAKIKAIKLATPDAVKETKKELADKGRSSFNVKSKTFAQMFTAKVYDKDGKRMPATLFYTRSHYFSIFEFGGKIAPKSAKGLFIPFMVNGGNPQQKRNGKIKFFKMLEDLKRQGKTFWKKKNGNLILFARVDTGVKGLAKYKKDYKTRTGTKRFRGGTVVALGILKKGVKIKKRFNFTNIAKKSYIPKLIRSFENKIILP